jgi:hypothetical protein
MSVIFNGKVVTEEEFEDTKGAIRIYISKKNRQNCIEDMSVIF